MDIGAQLLLVYQNYCLVRQAIAFSLCHSFYLLDYSHPNGSLRKSEHMNVGVTSVG